MTVYEIDYVTEDKSLDQAVAELKLIEGVAVLIVSEGGHGSGWPTIVFSATPEAKPKVEAWYGAEIED